MTNREKILLSLCSAGAIGVALSYGVDLMKPNHQSAIKSKDYTPLISQVQSGLESGQLTAYEQATLGAATAEWPRNPMGQKMAEIEVKSQGIKCPPYTGFLKIGGGATAIIGENDYRVGQMIEGGEFKLVSIFPDYIEVLLNGANRTVKVPIEKQNP